VTASDDVEPDDKDWTWVLGRPCPECGFDAAAVHATDVAGRIRSDAINWLTRLARPGVTERLRPDVWSALEYGCHVRDVHRIFDSRVHLMLDEDAPRFPNWDQDGAALTADYASQRPDTVAAELAAAAEAVADTYATVPDDAWTRRGLRSNGSEFTVASIAVYHLHDVVHHAWDVDSAV
jgi:hypothetical protein